MIRGEPHKAWSVVVLSAALAGCLLAALLWATEPADAASRFKIVTKTFSNTQPITIPEVNSATPYPSEVKVAGLTLGKILDANLTLKGFGHTFPRDVDVMLSHKGTNRTVMSDVGADFDVNDITLRLDDEAAGGLHSESQLTAGRFRPTNGEADFPDVFEAPAPAASGLENLSGFDGASPNGLWQLWVHDDGFGDSGQFAGGWSVTIKARVLR